MRVKKDVVEDVRRLIALLPPAVMTKCSVCNDTLTHHLTQVQAKAGAPLETVCREYTGAVNEMLPTHERLSKDAAANRVRLASGGKSLSRQCDRITPPGYPPRQAITVGTADQFVTNAISQLSRIDRTQDGWPEALARLERWLEDFKSSNQQDNGTAKRISAQHLCPDGHLRIADKPAPSEDEIITVEI